MAAVAKAGVAWYRRSGADGGYRVRAAQHAPSGANPFVHRPGATAWYRFYDRDTDTGFFCGRQPTGNRRVSAGSTGS
ncbi:hypothetical protein FHS02_000501 [Massilia umbonata]|uniref:Uncharacterized protein n=1 Tax=Pseudoduganella umbonata TaxID=864828 RepID=A0A7W5HAM0_9BURK|nr:hypothetical protein [Pseudoduganella umbonata]